MNIWISLGFSIEVKLHWEKEDYIIWDISTFSFVDFEKENRPVEKRSVRDCAFFLERERRRDAAPPPFQPALFYFLAYYTNATLLFFSVWELITHSELFVD